MRTPLIGGAGVAVSELKSSASSGPFSVNCLLMVTASCLPLSVRVREVSPLLLEQCRQPGLASSFSAAADKTSPCRRPYAAQQC